MVKNGILGHIIKTMRATKNNFGANYMQLKVRLKLKKELLKLKEMILHLLISLQLEMIT